jgi:hypothetical protein
MNLLYIVPRRVYESKMSRVRFDQIEAITKQMVVRISGPGWPDWDETRSAAENVANLPVGESGLADVVLAYEVNGFAGCVRPVMTSYNEAYDVPKVERYVEENRLRGVIFHHENDLLRYQPHWYARGILSFHIHHCASEAVYRDYELPKDIDVLVAGNLSRTYYPFRVRLRDLAWRVLRKRGYKVVVLDHPGYKLPPREGTVVREDFARLINRSKLVVTCAMRYKYALGKYAEIGLCRSLALADIPDERQEHFEQTVRVVHPWMLDEDILRIAEEVLDDEGLRIKLTNQAWDLTRQTSTMSWYAAEFLHAASAVGGAGPRT